jgi:hypothetical protein
MMGRSDRRQEQLFYSFCLEEVVRGDHLARGIKELHIIRQLSGSTRVINAGFAQYQDIDHVESHASGSASQSQPENWEE